jgi:small subunit ribosomal protein S20
MANHKSAEKRNRQRVKRTDRARALRSRVRATLKRARAALAENSSDAAALVAEATSLLGRAGSKNVIPKKRTARLVGRLALAFKKAQATPAA